MTEYAYRTEPLPYQRDVFHKTRDLAAHGLFLDPGTGKSKISIDTAAQLYDRGSIDGLLVVCPPNAIYVWGEIEIDKHLPERVPRNIAVYLSKRASTRIQREALYHNLRAKGLAVLVMSYDAFVTSKGSQAAKEFLEKRRCLYVVDESHRIKSPNPRIKRARLVVKSGKYAPYRRVLSGTPLDNSPFDAYNQIRFLDPDFWKRHGFGSYTAFKTYFGIFQRHTNTHTGYEFDKLIAYQHLDKLREILEEVSTRVRKDVLNLPPKIYSERVFDLTPEQRRVIKQIDEEYMAELASGHEIYAELPIVRNLRKQQVSCGYVPTDDASEPIHVLPGGNPRLDLLTDLSEDLPHQCIVWARFTLDIDLIMERFGSDAVRYDGRVKEEDRNKAVKRFMNGDAKYFVANAQTAGEALTLTNAKTLIYYSNTFKAVERTQSEDRAHRIGQNNSVEIIDIIGRGSVDRHIVANLRDKKDVAAYVLGDPR